MLLQGTAAAEGNIHAGPLRIYPFLTVSETFSGNIYFSATEEKSDAITTYTPGVGLQLPFGNHEAAAEYFSVISRYNTYSGEDTTDHTASGAVDFRIGSLFGIRISELFSKGHEARSASATGFIETFRNNRLSAGLSYQLADRSKLEFVFGKRTWSFPESSFRDRDEDIFSSRLFYRFLPKTSAFLEFDRANVSFDDASLDLDNEVTSGQIGVTWEMSRKSKGTIKGGRMEKDFESGSAQDFRGWTGSADFKHEFTDHASLKLLAERTVHETKLLGARYYVTEGGSGEFSYRLLRRLSAVLRGSYGVDSFSDPVPPDTVVRQDRTILEGFGLRYSIREWIIIDAGYDRRVRRSNIPVNNYNEHSYTFSAGIYL